MLSLLPQLLFLAPLGYLILRATLAALFLLGARDQWSPKASIPLYLLISAEVVTAGALVFGFLTQLAAIASLGVCILWIIFPKVRPYPMSTILLAGAMALTLLMSGAGAFAFDLPL